jgi:NlpC/P60 family
MFYGMSLFAYLASECKTNDATMQTIIRFSLGFSVLIAFCTACRPHSKGSLTYKRVGFAPFSEKDSHYQLRTRLVSQAAQQIGARYRGGKQSRSDGFDCSGLIFYAFQKVDIKTARIARQLAKDAKHIPVKAAKPGDLLFFGHKGSIGHVGMVAANDTSGVSMIHASSSKGVVKENISKQKYWMSRLQFAGDIIATCSGKTVDTPKKTEKSAKKTSKTVEKPVIAAHNAPETASKTGTRLGQHIHQGRLPTPNAEKSTHKIVLNRNGLSEHHGRMIY